MEGIQVNVNRGVVVLRGRITTAQDRWLCVSCSSRVAGVAQVIDELEIENGVAGLRRAK